MVMVVVIVCHTYSSSKIVLLGVYHLSVRCSLFSYVLVVTFS